MCVWADRYSDHSGKAAKTALPGLGDPVIGVDVTADGKIALATTERYLLVVRTEIKDGKNAGKTAFTSSLGASRQPPIKLTLDHKDIQRFNLTSIKFSRARFNTGGEEKEIVTSTGKLIITWNLRKVLAGRKFCYKIRKCEHEVVADDFLANNDAAVMVVHKNDVNRVNRVKNEEADWL